MHISVDGISMILNVIIQHFITLNSYIKAYNCNENSSSFSAEPDLLLRGHAHVPCVFQRHQLPAAARQKRPQHGFYRFPVPNLELQKPAPF